MRPKVALVLGGGGSRGIAHLGVLDVLMQAEIPVDMIVGTSMGAIVGALYAAGYAPREIAKRLSSMRGMNLLSMNLFSAKARQQRVADQLAPVFAGKTFADLELPLAVTAVDMISGNEVVLADGPLIPALLASSAVPGVFPPVEIEGMQLADGGVIDSVATHVAYQYQADVIIAVDVYPPLEQDNPWVDPITAVIGLNVPFLSSTGLRPPGVVSSLWRSVRVITWHLHEKRLQEHPPHILIRPPIGDTSSLDFSDLEGPFEAGFREGERILPMIQAMLRTPQGE
ncbi:MAG: patatin-like phospholipase family protein [Anaerolineae bacterium]|nr:patatin-like phospholipase family protein [Anaerolineae bacterium]